MATRKAKENDIRTENGTVSVYKTASGRFEPAGTVEEYREGQRRIRRGNRGSGEVADWNQADSEKLRLAIVAITRLGFAVRFGYTRDGGAFAVGIVGDGEPFTEFVRATEDIDLLLHSLATDYNAAPDNEFAASRQV